MNKLKILKHIEIADNSVFIDNTELLTLPETMNFAEFAMSVYKKFEIKYPKFHKMSNMCKLGFLGAELLLKNTELNNTDKQDIALVFSCKSSSLHTDTEYQNSLKEIPSPALFVYTLPNIFIGEICIRNRFQGEEMMFVQEIFDKEILFDYTRMLFNEKKAKFSLTGFVDFDENNNYFASIYLLEKS